MISVWRFGLFAPLALIGVSWLPCVPASARLDSPVPGAHRPSPQHEGLGGGLHEGVAAEGFLVDLHAQARAARQLQPAVASLDRAGEERRLLVAGRELDRQGAAERG